MDQEFETEDFEENTFYANIAKTYPNFATEFDLVCIPRMQSIFDKKSFKSNILAKHLFKSVVNCRTKSGGLYTGLIRRTFLGSYKTFAFIDMDKRQVITGGGYSEVKIVKIVKQDFMLVEDGTSLMRILLEQPLEGESSNASDPRYFHLCSSRMTVKESEHFLWTRFAFASEMCEMSQTQKLSLFRFAVGIDPKNLGKIHRMLKIMWADNCREFTRNIINRKTSKGKSEEESFNLQLSDDVRFQDCMRRAFESHLLNASYVILFDKICKLCKSDDDALDLKCHRLNPVRVETFQLPTCLEDIDSHLNPAVTELDKLNECSSIMDKLHCIERVVGLICAAVQKYSSMKERYGERGLRHVAADDLIPLMAWTMAKQSSSSRHVASNIHFINNFQLYDASFSNQLLYTLSTYMAAYTCILELDDQNVASVEMGEIVPTEPKKGDAIKHEVFFKRLRRGSPTTLPNGPMRGQ